MNEWYGFADDQLPDANIPTVTLTLAQLRRFRDSYAWLQQFAADVCGTTPERLCIWDVDKWRYQHGMPCYDPLMQQFAEEARRRHRQPGRPRQGQAPSRGAVPLWRRLVARTLRALSRWVAPRPK